jgi:hypothetical protein
MHFIRQYLSSKDDDETNESSHQLELVDFRFEPIGYKQRRQQEERREAMDL